MSVFGGDSWAREAQYRKRRVDDLVVDGIDGSSYKKLSSGKYTCLACPHNPILDTPLVLSMHIKGSRHRAAESRLKERELARQNEINKRIALSDCYTDSAKRSMPCQQWRTAGKPLIEQARKAASEILCNGTRQCTSSEERNSKLSISHSASGPSNHNNEGCVLIAEAAGMAVAQRQPDLQERREKELKFRAAGWKRDCHGKWFKDENVEFDSDEEDPNISLA